MVPLHHIVIYGECACLEVVYTSLPPVCCNCTGYGGPHAGFFAVKRELIKLIPGRLVGQTR